MPRFASSLLALALVAMPALACAQTTPAPSPSAAATESPDAVQQLAVDIFNQLVNKSLNRALFTDAANAAMTDQIVQELGQQLSGVGQPSFLFLNVQPADGGITVYTYLMRTASSGNLDFIIALDSTGKIAGIHFAVDHSH